MCRAQLVSAGGEGLGWFSVWVTCAVFSAFVVRLRQRFRAGLFGAFAVRVLANGFFACAVQLGNEVERAFLWRVPAARAVVWFGVGLWLICVAGASGFKSKVSVKIAQHGLRQTVCHAPFRGRFPLEKHCSVSWAGPRGNPPLRLSQSVRRFLA